MFTRNWYKALASNQFQTKCTLVDVKGALNSNGFLPHYGNGGTVSECMKSPQKNTSLTYAGVYFGTGRTAPTLDDYKLSGDVVSNYACSTALSAVHEDDGSIITGLYTITNTGADAVTIGEIGLVATILNGSSGSGYTLFERTVLESPITIEPGGVGQVTYTIKLNYPTG